MLYLRTRNKIDIVWCYSMKTDNLSLAKKVGYPTKSLRDVVINMKTIVRICHTLKNDRSAVTRPSLDFCLLISWAAVSCRSFLDTRSTFSFLLIVFLVYNGAVGHLTVNNSRAHRLGLRSQGSNRDYDLELDLGQCKLARGNHHAHRHFGAWSKSCANAIRVTLDSIRFGPRSTHMCDAFLTRSSLAFWFASQGNVLNHFAQCRNSDLLSFLCSYHLPIRILLRGQSCPSRVHHNVVRFYFYLSLTKH